MSRIITTAEHLRITEERALEVLEEAGAILRAEDTGEHYLLASSGLHTGTFFRLGGVFSKLHSREWLVRLLLLKMQARGVSIGNIKALVGPESGASSLLYEFQHSPALADTIVIPFKKDEGRNGEFKFPRGFSLGPDEGVFIVDDATVTFSTIRKTIAVLRKAQPECFIMGVVVFLDRAPMRQEDPSVFATTLQYVYGIRQPLEAYAKEQCPYCQQNIELVIP